jgi:predicted Zn-dependent protease
MNRSRGPLLVLVLLFALCPSRTAPLGAAPSASLADILQAELARNVAVLQKEPVPPYFVSYAVYDTRSIQMAASFGGIVADLDSRNRSLSVDVRTGEYGLDNTHEIRGEAAAPPSLGRATVPLTDSDAGVAVAAWRTTDRAYRQAVERLARVKSNVAAKVKEDDPAPDFSREEPQTFTGAPAAPAIDRAAWRGRLRRLSALFADDPLVMRAEVSLSVDAVTRTMVSTEGTRLLTGDAAFRLGIQAQTKAEDGMELPIYATYFARTAEGLPAEDRLTKDVREMLVMLAKLRAAPIVDPYSGPAVLSGRAAGVFFHEIFGHRIEGARQKNADDAQTFAKKVGQPVLPLFLSVYADPTLRRLGDVELAGYYQYDDEGEKGRRVTVVDQGVLKEFLLSRSPLARFPNSNGHGRGQPGIRPVSRQSNLLVESSAGVTPAQLIERLRDECRKAGKPFGLLFDQVEGGFTFTNRFLPNAFNVTPIVVYRVYADGRPMELVRGVDLIGTPLAAFGKIVATDNRPATFNGVCGAESGQVPVSASSPALLVSEVEVQKKGKSQETLPILPAPTKAAVPKVPADAPVLRAMQAELTRSMDGLRLKDQPAPYYGACAVTDASQTRYAATLGAMTADAATRFRLVRVDVRVGDYAFDSSRFIGPGLGGMTGSIAMLPIDDDEVAIRRQIWLSADASYKGSVQAFARKKAAFQNRNDTDPLPDFSIEPPFEHVEPIAPAAPVPASWAEFTRQVSELLKVPEVVASDAQMSIVSGTRYFVNSEGFRTVVPVGSATLRVSAEALADDGMAIRDSVVVDAASPGAMPAPADLLARTRQMLDGLLAARGGKTGEDYSGPVLVERDAAASLVAQSLVPLFLSQRAPDSEDGRMGQATAGSLNPFLTRIGNRVLPESFSVRDTPSVSSVDGVALGGAYVVDDEGVRAQDVTLVRDGRLLTLLTSRTPQKNLLKSNGHGRDGGAQAGVVQIESAGALAAAALRARYLEILKTQGRPFGYIIRRLGSGMGRQGSQLAAVAKVTPDGREEPVRGLVLGSVTHTAFRDIVAASSDRTVLTFRASGGGPGGTGGIPTPGGGALVSVVTPSLIFEELDVQKSKDTLQKKPIVPSPIR